MPTTTKRYLWLGGSFNPVHLAHLELANQLACKLDAQVFLLPSGKSAFDKPLAPINQRLAMLQLALAKYPRLHIDERETHRTGISYTYKTLKELRTIYGKDAHITFVLGEDTLCFLHKWKNYRQILSKANLLILLRNNTLTTKDMRDRLTNYSAEVQQLLTPALCNLTTWKKSLQGKVIFWNNDLVPISSTDIRQLSIQQAWGKLSPLLPASVLNYLREVQPYS